MVLIRPPVRRDRDLGERRLLDSGERTPVLGCPALLETLENRSLACCSLELLAPDADLRLLGRGPLLGRPALKLTALPVGLNGDELVHGDRLAYLEPARGTCGAQLFLGAGEGCLVLGMPGELPGELFLGLLLGLLSQGPQGLQPERESTHSTGWTTPG